MRKTTTVLLAVLCISLQAKAEYTDHRGHNVDSLETVMAGWTAKSIAEAGGTELRNVAKNLEELMYGFNQTNSVKSEYYARMLLGISRSNSWYHYEELAAKNIGQHFWAKEEYDSAAIYYGMAMKAVERMSEPDAVNAEGQKFDQKAVDDALSQIFGALGNLYSSMDSVDLSMDYYGRAGVLFKKYGWHNSNSVLYYNMGETMRCVEEYEKAEGYYLESLKYSNLADDDLAVATAKKGLGSLYLETGRTSKALHYLTEANSYFAEHEEEELYFRMESLDYTRQVLALQKRRLWAIILLIAALALTAAASFYVSRRLKKSMKEKRELTEILEETVETIALAPGEKAINLKPREKEILTLIAKGYTNAEIAGKVCLSPETIKWYKKKLFAMFDAANSAELVSKVKDMSDLMYGGGK